MSELTKEQVREIVRDEMHYIRHDMCCYFRDFVKSATPVPAWLSALSPAFSSVLPHAWSEYVKHEELRTCLNAWEKWYKRRPPSNVLHPGDNILSYDLDEQIRWLREAPIDKESK